MEKLRQGAVRSLAEGHTSVQARAKIQSQPGSTPALNPDMMLFPCECECVYTNLTVMCASVVSAPQCARVITEHSFSRSWIDTPHMYVWKNTAHMLENMLCLYTHSTHKHTHLPCFVPLSQPSPQSLAPFLRVLLDCSLFPHTHPVREGGESRSGLTHQGHPCSPCPWFVASVWEAASTNYLPSTHNSSVCRTPTWLPSHASSWLVQDISSPQNLGTSC